MCYNRYGRDFNELSVKNNRVISVIYKEVMIMKKYIPMFCYVVSAILTIIFIVKSIVDYSQYSTIENSAPFSAWVLANACYFIIPAIIVLIVGIIVKKKQ